MENIKTIFKKKNIDFFFPISFILTIIPLIVRVTFNDPDQNTLDIFGTAAKADLFSQKKALFLMIFSIILVVIAVIFFKKIFEKKDKFVNSILIASFIFLIFTLLSTIFSTYKETALWGAFDRAEGLITITCYIILLVYSIYTFKSTKDYTYVTKPILILVCINAFLGLFQYVGQDLIKTNLGALIATGDSNSKLNLLFESGKLYGTLYHYNFVGSFVAIVLPILFCLTLFEFEDILYKISLGIGTLLSVWLLFGSTSRAGIIGISASIIFGLIIFWKLIIKKRKALLICIISVLLLIIGLNVVTKGSIFKRIPSLMTDITSVFKDASDFDYRDHVLIKDIKYTDKTTDIILQKETLKISYSNNNFVFTNSKGQSIDFFKNTNNIYTTSNNNFKNIYFKPGKLSNKSTKTDALSLYINNQPAFAFALRDNNIIHLINLNTGKDIDLEFPDSFGFKGKEKLGSARGYIWSRSIPLLKDNLILGGGPDTFPFRFPQNDLIGKLYAYDTPNMVVDKTHNLYLQIALNYGGIALIAFLFIVLVYIIDSLKLYALKKDYENNNIFGAATSLGVIGYLFAGIFNDSVVSVAPVFWIVLGVGISLNYMNRQELNKKQK